MITLGGEMKAIKIDPAQLQYGDHVVINHHEYAVNFVAGPDRIEFITEPVTIIV